MKKKDEFRECREAQNFRRLAFFCVVISTVSTFAAVIVVPMLYNYLQYIHSNLMVCEFPQKLWSDDYLTNFQTEMDFCRSRLDDLVIQFVHLEDAIHPLPLPPIANRHRRNAEEGEKPGLARQHAALKAEINRKRTSGITGRGSSRTRGSASLNKSNRQAPYATFVEKLI